MLRNHIDFQVVECLSFEIDKIAITMAGALTASLTWATQQHRDLNAWPQLAQSMTIAPDRLYVVLSGTECTDTSRGTLTFRQKGAEWGLHASRSRTFWLWYEGTRCLAQRAGYHNLCHLVELPPCPSQDDTRDLIDHAGWFIEAKGHLWGGATRDRWYFTNPPIREAAPISTKAPVHTLGNGYQWPASHMACTNPPTLRAVWPHIISRVGGRTASESEKRTFMRLQVRNTTTGHIKLAGPFEFSQWLGFSMEETNIIMRHPEFACYGTIDPITLRPPHQHKVEQEGEPCGTHRLCHNCCKATERLGKSWHLVCATGHLIPLLIEAATAQQARDPRMNWQFAKAPHKCGPTCPMIRTIPGTGTMPPSVFTSRHPSTASDGRS